VAIERQRSRFTEVDAIGRDFEAGASLMGMGRSVAN